MNPDVGPVGRSVVDEQGPIKARGRVNTSTGRPKREAEPEAEVEALVNRGRLVLYPGAPLAGPVGDLEERACGSRPVGEGSAADPRKFKTAGGSRREAEPIKRDIGFPEGGSSTDSRRISNEDLATRGHVASWPRMPDAEASNDVVERGNAVPWTPKRDVDQVDDLIERDPGLIRHPGGSPKRDLAPGGSSSYRREAEPIKNAPGGGCPRDASPIKIPPGGCGQDATPQPRRLDIGKDHDRRDADPGFVRPGGGTRPRDAIPGTVRPFGGTRVPRGIRGSGANPRGVRPGNGDNQ